MGKKKIVKQSVASSIACNAWYIESMGMVATANKFSDAVYDFILRLLMIKEPIVFVVMLLVLQWVSMYKL